MTWSLNASGHLQDAEAENGLVRDLRQVLTKYGTQASVFGGTFAGRVEGLHVKDGNEDCDGEDGTGTGKAAGRSHGRSRPAVKQGDKDGPGDGVHDEKPKALGVSRSAAPGAK